MWSIYGRRSNEKLDSSAVLGQLKEGVHLTLTNGRVVGGAAWDFKSGVTFDRPGWKALEANVRRGATSGVITSNISRASRERLAGLAKFTELSSIGCDFYFPRDFVLQRARMSNPIEWGITCMSLAASETERLMIAKRADDAIEQMIEDGLYPGDPKHARNWPFHTIQKGPNKQAEVVARPDGAQRFRELLDTLRRDLSTNVIKDFANRWGCQPHHVEQHAALRWVIGRGEGRGFEGETYHERMALAPEDEFDEVRLLLERLHEASAPKIRPIRLVEVGSQTTPERAITALRWGQHTIRHHLGLICQTCAEAAIVAIATPYKGASPSTDWVDVFICPSDHETRVGSEALDALAREGDDPRCMGCRQVGGVTMRLVKVGAKKRLHVHCKVCGLEFESAMELRPAYVRVALQKHLHLPEWERLNLDRLYPPTGLATQDTAGTRSPTQRRGARSRHVGPCGSSSRAADGSLQTVLDRQWPGAASPS